MRIVDDIGEFIFVQDEPKPADIIFIPGGSHPELGEYAADLYRRGYARTVMPSGNVSVKTGRFPGPKSKREIYDGDYRTEAAFLFDVLRKNGVPETSIILEDAAGCTSENASFSRKKLDAMGIKVDRAIVCCKCFHARRCLIDYQLAFPDVALYMYPIPYRENGIDIARENWYRSEAGVRRVLGELRRCGDQFVDGYISFLSASPNP